MANQLWTGRHVFTQRLFTARAACRCRQGRPHAADWPQRSVYGVARGLADQLQAGQDYRHLRPAIGISLLVHDLFTDHPAKADWHFTLRDTQYPQVQLDQALQVHIIELRKAETLGKLPVPLSAWIACLLHNLDEAVMNEITHPPVKEALAHLETMYSDEELRLMAQRREQALVDYEDGLDYARHEGQIQLLTRLLERKFGPVPRHYQTQLSRSSADQLQDWSLNVLDAQRIEDVFV
ncbi:PD-(D/E)XK nuclease family transposase [Pollutimonas bauzanensis]|uniref:PD-(D/E)XK nuclease family transposase n=1 Tax=Pollutimonas bauzanensis TaxID=658167 RepID=UPI0015B4AC63|nr:PD-(D/E)XK nuclease family transposase [Pollutimonas bauzanensis]